MHQAQLKSKLIGVSMQTLDTEFYRELGAGLQDEAQRSDIELEVLTSERDTSEQTDQIARFVREKKVSAIFIVPSDSTAIGYAIEHANGSGIPVFTGDIRCESAAGKVVSHISSDNYTGGKKAAELMLHALNGSGGVLIVATPGISSAADRVRGFKEVIAQHAAIHTFREIPVWALQRSEMTSLLKTILAKSPNVNGVYCMNDDVTLASVAAVKAIGRTGKLAVIGYDAGTEARIAIRQGLIYGSVIQYPRRIGELAICTIRDHLAGSFVPPEVPVEVGIITAADEQKHAR